MHTRVLINKLLDTFVNVLEIETGGTDLLIYVFQHVRPQISHYFPYLSSIKLMFSSLFEYHGHNTYTYSGVHVGFYSFCTYLYFPVTHTQYCHRRGASTQF